MFRNTGVLCKQNPAAPDDCKEIVYGEKFAI
jgi:hypothetical protein